MSSSSSTASSTQTPTASSANNAAPTPGQSGSPLQSSQIIVICVIVGVAVASSVVFIIIAMRKRDVRVRRLRLKRAATPLPDSEFDTWRKPTKDPVLYHSGGTTIYRSTGLRYNGLKAPAPLVHAFRVPSSTKIPTTSARPVTPPQLSSSSPKHEASPSTSVRPLIRSTSIPSVETKRSHHKSSVSIHDRPPTPYSPSSPPSVWDNETLWQEEAPMSPREKRHRVHTSDTSDFDFGFGYGPPDSPRREPIRRESWVHHSRRFSSLSTVAQPNYQSFRLDLEAAKKMDYY